MSVAMVTASSSVRMFLDPILVHATLVLPSMRMEGLAKVCGTRDNLDTAGNRSRSHLQSLTVSVCKILSSKCVPIPCHYPPTPSAYRNLIPELRLWETAQKVL